MALFAPHITSPKGGELFNLGKVAITWDRNDPPTEDPYAATTVVTYEIEYTDNYNYENTTWHTLKRRVPWSEVSYEWIVGKMIKSSSVRLRIRAKNIADGELSDWSMPSGDFSVNVFKLIPPAIVSPLPSHVYTDFILIILDESLTRNTFSQKVRYTLEYSSEKRDLGWTVIVQDLPVGQNVIRWDLEGLAPSDDYVLRLVTKNASTSCLEATEASSDQISRRFVYDLKIQQPGMFLIDTKPPQTILDVEDSAGITNQVNQTINIYSEDATTEVEQIQIRECNATTQVGLGNVDAPAPDPDTLCPSIETLIAADDADFGKLIGKPLGYSTKTQWTLNNESGLKRLEALVTDTGGNTSVQNISQTFIPIFRHTAPLRDIVIASEQRDELRINMESTPPEVSTDPVTYEVAYVVSQDGTYWLLEPFPRLRAFATTERDFRRLFVFNTQVHLFAYGATTGVSEVYRDDVTDFALLFTFPNYLSEVNDIANFQGDMYVGLENGELWKYDAVTFSLLTTFPDPVSALEGDNDYLYVGSSNSSLFYLYNGTQFFTSDVET